MNIFNSLFKKSLIGLIRLYQYGLSPLLGPCCRMYPSCSAYTVEAIDAHGVVRGMWLAIKRISRCHPWGPAWHCDPVPPVDGGEQVAADRKAGPASAGVDRNASHRW